jgi:hypothetical protein
MDALRRIARLLEEIAARRSEDLANSSAAATENEGSGHVASQRDVKVSAILSGQGDEISGPIADVFAEFDRRHPGNLELRIEENKVKTVAVLLGSKETSYFGFHEDGSPPRAPILLGVKSSDRGWARQAFVQLSEEIQKGVPAWSWLCREGGTLFSFVVTLAVFMATGFVLSWPIPQNSFPPALGIFIGLGVVASFATLIFHSWLFPRFEVNFEGMKSSGSRRLAWLGTLLLAIPIGILVNVLTSSH